MTSVGASENAAKNEIDAENIRQWSCDQCVTGSTAHESQPRHFDVLPTATGGVFGEVSSFMRRRRRVVRGWTQNADPNATSIKSGVAP
jgi:hypothetical protein